MPGRITSWISIARRRDIVTSSIKVGLVVGTVLASINYADKIWLGTLQPLDMLKIAVTYTVPFMVSTYASVQTVLRDQANDE